MPRKKKKPIEALPPLTIAPCARCGASCMVRAPDVAEESTPIVTIRAATTTRGMCRECAAHWWLFSVDGLRWSVREANDGVGVLCYPNVQAALARLLGLMHPELAGCDWERLIAQRDLPWPADWALPEDKT